MNLRIGLATGVLLLASACGQSGAPAPVAAVPPAASEAPLASSTANAEAPPTVGGVFVDKGACPGEVCHFGRMQAEKALDLYDAPGPAAKVIGQVAADEWMDTLTTEDRFAPVRGLVRKGGENFKAGDVVYRLGYEGEGCSTVWDKGQLKSWCDMGEQTPGDPGELIDWDTATPDTDGSEAMWVQVKPDKSMVGWLRDPRDLRCIGMQDREPGCPDLPN